MEIIKEKIKIGDCFKNIGSVVFKVTNYSDFNGVYELICNDGEKFDLTDTAILSSFTRCNEDGTSINSVTESNFMKLEDFKEGLYVINKMKDIFIVTKSSHIGTYLRCIGSNESIRITNSVVEFNEFQECDKLGNIAVQGTIEEIKKTKIELIEELNIKGETFYSIAINGIKQIATITLDKAVAEREFEKIKQGYKNAKKTVLKSEEI